MGLLIQYVAIYAPWIYAICGLVALYHIYRTWQVRAERRQALFSLEREKAMRDLFNILSVSMLLLLIMGITYFSSEVLARAIQSEATIRPLATSTPAVFQPLPTPTDEPALPTPQVVITDTVAPAQDIAPQPVAPVVVEEVATNTPEPAPAAPVAAVCPDPRVQLTSPSSGQTLAGSVAISGAATHEQFQYYKLEYAPGANAEDGFVYFAGGNSAIPGGTIGTLQSTALTNGTWTIRLVVVDSTGNFPPPCAVTINVQN